MNINLELASVEDAQALLNIQKEAFKPLYEIYNDDISPYLHSIEDMEISITYPQGAYYKIIADGFLCGASRIAWNKDGLHRVMISYIASEYFGKGIVTEALGCIEKLHPKATAWETDVPVDQPKNIRSIEKAGYISTGEREIINDKLVLAYYRKPIS